MLRRVGWAVPRSCWQEARAANVLRRGHGTAVRWHASWRCAPAVRADSGLVGAGESSGPTMRAGAVGRWGVGLLACIVVAVAAAVGPVGAANVSYRSAVAATAVAAMLCAPVLAVAAMALGVGPATV